MTKTTTIYEIQAQRRGKHQSRWNVADDSLPTEDEQEAYALVREWTEDNPHLEFRVAVYQKTFVMHSSWERSVPKQEAAQ